MNVPDIVLHPTASVQLDAFLAAPKHAVLLAGPTGIGMRRIARSISATLLGVTEEALEGYGYYRELPVSASIGIEQIRELIGFFRLKVPGSQAIRRIAHVPGADSMTTEAQNALLKLLEEPPADSVLILTSSQPEHLLPTIRSRTQLLHLPAPDPSQLHAYFAAAGHPEAAIAAVLLRSGTNVAEAERLLTADGEDEAVALVKQVLRGTPYDRLLLVEGLAKQKESLQAFVDALATVAMVSLDAAAHKGAASVKRWQTVLQAASTAADALNRSGNAKLVLTELMLAL